MKRRTSKKALRSEEQNLAQTLKSLLANANGELPTTALREFSSGLAHLLAVHLQLDPSWDHKQRWLDEVEWSSLSSSGMTLNGNGKLWWGYRARPSAALFDVEFEATVQLRVTARCLDICYVVKFEDECVGFCIRSLNQGC